MKSNGCSRKSWPRRRDEVAGFGVKVYVVQAASGEVLDVKLTHAAAHAVAVLATKEKGPCRALPPIFANKIPARSQQTPGGRDGNSYSQPCADKTVLFGS